MPQRKLPLQFPEVHKAILEKGYINDFVRWSGLHQMTYYKMQAGRTTPSMFTINQILDYTGKTYEELFRQ